ncbi:MAG: histidine phosphatase family protein [Gammaproteobacteria bacterium]
MNEQERQARRARKHRRRRNTVIGFMVLSVGLAWFFESQSTTTIIIARHAEENQLGGRDPGLSQAGRARAEQLAIALKDIDVITGLDAIFIHPNKLSRETVLPVSMNTDAPVHSGNNPDKPEKLVSRMLRKYEGKIILLVVEAEYIQPLIAEMQGSKKLPEIADDEYDNLFIVTIPWFGKVKTLRLSYGDRYKPEA